MAPDPALVDRFRDSCLRLIGAEPDRFGAAVSGGPDSVALLLLARAAFPGRVSAATVDHGLRSEAASEAAFVADLCARIGVPHTVLKVEVPPKGEGLQGEARRARYDALRRWTEERGLPVLATAHHADDQAETLLMRLRRGSGVGGLAGVRPLRREGSFTVLRPLLGWTREELAEVVTAAGISPVDDPSNRDPRFDRAATRAFLAANPDFDARRLARSAAALAEADAALEWAADLLEAERCSACSGEWRIDPAGLPRELRRRLLARGVAAVRREHGIAPEWTGNEDVEGLLGALESGGTATLAGVMASGGATWRLRAAPPRRPVASHRGT